MKNRNCFAVLLAMAAGLALFAGAANAQISVNLSGYEVFLGVNCYIGGQPATCGVRFGGWTGGDGAVADGWTRFPGDRQGLWDANVNYTGSAGFNHTANLVGGLWNVFLRDGSIVTGVVNSGAVTWPPTANDDIGCGKAVATVLANLTLKTGGGASFNGCLHDLPAFTVIPPKVWGTIY
jgi:hypothetical protein